MLDWYLPLSFPAPDKLGISTTGTSLMLIIPPISGGVYYEVHQGDNRSSIKGKLSSTGDILSLPLNSNEVIFSHCYKNLYFHHRYVFPVNSG